MLFHVIVEFLDTFNPVDGPKTLVAHEPMGFLLGQVAVLLERGLAKQSFIASLLDKVQLHHHQE